MKSAILVPHADDETLFASHIIRRYDPDIYLLYLPADEAEREIREHEFQDALTELTWDKTSDFDWLGGFEGDVLLSLQSWLEDRRPPVSFLDRKLHTVCYDRIFAPAPYEDGHVEHDHTGTIAIGVCGPNNVTCYHTYTRSEGRIRQGNEVTLSPIEISSKLRALACYRSQIEHPARRPWFTDLLDLKEWFE